MVRYRVPMSHTIKELCNFVDALFATKRVLHHEWGNSIYAYFFH